MRKVSFGNTRNWLILLRSGRPARWLRRRPQARVQFAETFTRTMGDLAAQNARLKAMIKQALDRMTAMDNKVDDLQEKFASTNKRTDQLESRLAAVPPRMNAGKEVASENDDTPRSSLEQTSATLLPRSPSEGAPSRPAVTDSSLGCTDHGDAHLRRGDARGVLG